ncbi:MAG: hypothetical protein K6F35_06130 [Lachnospiraceae bacterium]|nr:hypothetical protein [Lachnospiraceae bacterium]
MDNPNVELEMARFVEDGEGMELIHVPQCVACAYNTGLNGCEIFGSKPEAYLTNTEDCPVRQEEGEDV